MLKTFNSRVEHPVKINQPNMLRGALKTAADRI